MHRTKIFKKTCVRSLLFALGCSSNWSYAAPLVLSVASQQGTGTSEAEAALQKGVELLDRQMDAGRNEIGEALPSFQKALALSSKKKDPWLYARVYEGLGRLFFMQGDWAQAVATLQHSVDLFRTAVGEQHTKTASAHRRLAQALAPQGKVTQAITHEEKAIAIFRKLGEAKEVAITTMNLGMLFVDQANFPKALETLNRSLQMLLALGGETQTVVAGAYLNLGSVYRGMGDLPHAVNCYQKALEIRVATLGSAHPLTEQARAALKETRALQADAGVVHAFQHSLELSRATVGEKHSIAAAHSNLATALVGQGELDKAAEHYEKSLTLLNNLGDQHGVAATTINPWYALCSEEGLSEGTRYP